MAANVSGAVRVALIGSGGISAAHGKGFLKHADKIKVVAMVDVSPDNLKKRGEQLGGNPKTFSDWKVMLKEMETSSPFATQWGAVTGKWRPKPGGRS